MTESQQDHSVQTANKQSTSEQEHLLSSTTNSSPTNSISLIWLDELSSFGATRQSRLPALIKLNNMENNQAATMSQHANSMPAFDAGQLERSQAVDRQQSSLPAQVRIAQEPAAGDKENLNSIEMDDEDANSTEGFQVVDMMPTDVMGPSLPPPKSLESADKRQDSATAAPATTTGASSAAAKAAGDSISAMAQRQVLGSNQQITNQYPSHLGDSLIEMVINLRNENQNLVRALEANNDYVKERLNEFKLSQEESKKREAQFALERAELEHKERKLQRQNQVLSDRLKSMEAKLKDMKLEVSESLNAAHSSKNSSIRDEPIAGSSNLYPQLNDSGSFGNSALNQASTMQVDATSGELLNEGDESSDSESDEESSDDSPTAPPMETDASEAKRVGAMSKEELSKRFDADKAQFYAMDDPMKQCDELERQLNDIGKRDYEICLLQQQLNIYRQDFRLERMAKLEAKIQIEKLKNDIDRLCLDRVEEQKKCSGQTVPEEREHGKRHSRHRSSIGGVRFDPAVAAAEAVMGKFGQKLSRKAARSAAKAVKYAAKQAHIEEKAAAYAAAAAAASAANQPAAPGAAQSSGAPGPEEYHGRHGHHHHHHRRHSHHNKPRGPSIRSEVVNDLLTTANKAMLTGYKMASTHVNLALDKLSAFEQAQASNLAVNKQPSTATGVSKDQQKPSAPMDYPSID